MLPVREADSRVEQDLRPAAIRAFEPTCMKVGVLTAALQELTPREIRDTDPDRAIGDRAAFAHDLGVDHIQGRGREAYRS